MASGVYRHRPFSIEIDVPAFNAHRKVRPKQHKTTRIAERPTCAFSSGLYIQETTKPDWASSGPFTGVIGRPKATRRSGVHSRRVQTRGMCGTSLFLLGWPLVVTRHWRVTKKRKFVAQERDRAYGSALRRPGTGHRCVLCPLTCFGVKNYPFRVAA